MVLQKHISIGIIYNYQVTMIRLPAKYRYYSNVIQFNIKMNKLVEMHYKLNHYQ